MELLFEQTSYESIWFMNHFFLGYLGWFFWALRQLRNYKNKLDESQKKFYFKKFIMEAWDDYLYSGVAVFILVLFAPTIWSYIIIALDKDYPFTDLMYLGVGPFVVLIDFIVEKFTK